MSHSTDTSQSAGHDSRQSSIFEPPEYSIFYGPDNTLHWEPTVGSAELAIALSYSFPLEKDLASKMRAATRKFLKNQSKAKCKRRENEVSAQEHVLSQSDKSQDSGPFPMERKPSSYQNYVQPPSQPVVPGKAASTSYTQLPDSSASLSPPKKYQNYPMVSVEKLRKESFDIETAVPLSQPGEDVEIAACMATTHPFQILSWAPENSEFGKARRKRPYEKDEKAQVAANRGYACEAHRRRKAKCDPGRCPNNGQNRKAIESRAEKRQRSTSKLEHELSKSAPNAGSSSTTRTWAPQDLVCPSSSLTPDHSVNLSPHPITSSSSSSVLGAPWGPRNSSLFHTLYSPIWQLPWGYDDGRSGLCHIFQNGKFHRNAKDGLEVSPYYN